MVTALHFIMLTSDNDFEKIFILETEIRYFVCIEGEILSCLLVWRVQLGNSVGGWTQSAAYDHEVNNLTSSFTLLLHLLYTYYVVYICNSQRQKL